MYQINFVRSAIRSLMLVVLLLSVFKSVSQPQHQIDSLNSLLRSSSDEQRFEILAELSRLHFDSDYEAALNYNNIAYAWALARGDSLKMVTSARRIGQLYNRMGKSKEALETLSKALPVAYRNNFEEEYKRILNNIAVAYSYRAEYDKALEYHFQTLAMREEDGDVAEISVSLNNIGLVYFKLRNYPKALEFYTKALEYLEKSTDKSFLGQQLINIGLCHNQMKNFNQAFESFQKAFESCGSNCQDIIKVSGWFGMGVANFGLGKYDDAVEYFNRSLETAKATGNTRYEGENLVYLGKIYIELDKPADAENALHQAEKISTQYQYNELLIDTYRQFSVLYNQVNDHFNASAYQRKYITLKDSVYSEQLIDKIAELQTDFAERENLATIAAKEEVITRQRMLNFSIGIIAVLAALLVFVLYRSNRTVRRVNMALSEAKTELQLLNADLDKKVKEKTASLQKVNEELDNFIYKTSHDIRGPLASLKGICNLAIMESKDPVTLDYLKKLSETAEKLNKILTRLVTVNQINSTRLDFESISMGALVDEIIMTESKRGLPPRFVIKKEIDKALTFFSDRELVRIILENLIDNAIKFYNDSERVDPFVRIKISQQNGYLQIYVIDNGVGISRVDPDKIFQMFMRASERSETGGIGLYLTKLATERLGGSISLGMTPEGYTEFRVNLPFTTQPAEA
ncbi:MAG: tetratricopeptide repeat-containing sensor histidine kinase [Cyclobacteriaceae bacterium]|nr:tetratricopeptide repeat-containing sensor histidine kinase [Cyclobacteriaceae bacterium]